ncbi:MAG: hypothetical protein ACREH4_03900 [Vitreimonas sp.]
MSAAREYWFARRFPVGHARKALAPVHWKGWVLSAVYVLLLCAGGFAFAWLGAGGRVVEGVIVFVLAAAVGAGGFITIAEATANKTRTVEDYRKARTGV